MEKTLKWYGVVSPIIEHVSYDYDEPPEYYTCYTEVEATNKREAIKKAIGTKEFSDWVKYQRADEKNPFSGVKAEELPDEEET